MLLHPLNPQNRRLVCQIMSDMKDAIVVEAEQGAVRPHQPGQEVFRSVPPEDIDWKPFAAFPPSVRLAVVVGHPSEAGPYTVRVRVPHGVKLMPHRHPEDRVYTVISGVFYIGLSDQFDPEQLRAYPPGSVIILPGNTSHFHWAKSSEYVTQISAIGPLGLEYLITKDDPRHNTCSEATERVDRRRKGRHSGSI
jgi:quercetin dioxygenase-like cupin family protein